MVATSTDALTLEKVQQAIAILISGLQPTTETQHQAIAAFNSGDYKQVKKLSLLNLDDKYIQALGYLGGALNPVNLASGNSYTVLAESVRNFKLYDSQAWQAIEADFNAAIEG
jgi:hypothetical protein